MNLHSMGTDNNQFACNIKNCCLYTCPKIGPCEEILDTLVQAGLLNWTDKGINSPEISLGRSKIKPAQWALIDTLTPPTGQSGMSDLDLIPFRNSTSNLQIGEVRH